MTLDLEYLITLFEKFSEPKSNELKEDEAAPAATTSAPSTGGGTTGGGSGRTPKKWESGVARGKANQIAVTKWESGRKFGKTYMNDPKYKWSSDRSMGKTGGSDFT
jgi:hypothetical protein